MPSYPSDTAVADDTKTEGKVNSYTGVFIITILGVLVTLFILHLIYSNQIVAVYGDGTLIYGAF